MRRCLALLPALPVVITLGCGPNTPTEYTGPAITPVTGKTVPGGYGPPGEGPPEGGTKPPAKPPGTR